MKYYVPTELYSDTDCINKYGNIMKRFGKTAFIVTGRSSSKKNGSLRAVENKLDECGISYTVFDSIEENPCVETIAEAAKKAEAVSADFIIGIGGGSPMDAAKAVALLAANPAKSSDILYEKAEYAHLPVIEVPTTAGTGSEVTPWSILTIHDQRTKKGIPHHIYPAAAFADREYLKYAPISVIKSTAADALCHLVESYLVVKATDYSRVFSSGGLKLWGKIKDKLTEGNLSDEDYEDMLTASTLAGMAIAHTGTGFPHALSYPITYETGLAHGYACAVSLAGYLSCYSDKEKVKDVLTALGFSDIDDFCNYLKKFLSSVSLNRELWDRSVSMLMHNEAKLATYPVSISEQTVRDYINFIQ